MATIINSSTSNGLVMTPDTSGEIELQANGVTKAKVTANGLQDANGASLRGGSFRNLIINGDMQIAQRGTSVSSVTSTGYRAVDRFRIAMSSAGTWTISQSTDVPSGQGFANSMKMDCTTADASLSANDNLALQHHIEGQNLQYLKYGTSSAESLTLSFWVKSNKTGTYTVEFEETGNARHFCKTYTIDSASTWEKKTITISGDTASALANDNTLELRPIWWLAAGSIFTSGTLNTSGWSSQTTANRVSSSQVNLADSTSNYINITGVQLEVGSGASDFEFLPYDVQLARCQRYFIKTNPDDLARPTFLHGLHFANNASLAALYANLPTRMRTAPSITRGGTNDNFWNPGYSASATANFNPTYTLSTPDGLFIELSSISVGANSAPIGYNGQLSLNAEL